LNLQKACNEEIIYYIWRTPDEERDKIYLERKKRELKEEISRWEEYLTNEGFYFKSNRVLCGDEFSLADVFFFPQLAFAVRMGYPIERHPKLSKIIPFSLKIYVVIL
jgi:glutathione S-transferase